MSDPVQLRQAEADPDARVVDALEGLLERARSGELRGFVLVGSLTGDETAVVFVGEIDCPKTVAYAGAVKHRAMREWLGA